ncbi:MAG: hypothetical protein ABIO70_33675 [Pseudomonadota bacterium]
MKHTRLYIWLVVLLMAAGVLALFILQNYERTTDLSINLFFFSRHLAQPVSVPLLLLGTFAGGGLVGLIAGFLLRGRGRSGGSSGPGLDDAWA